MKKEYDRSCNNPIPFFAAALIAMKRYDRRQSIKMQ